MIMKLYITNSGDTLTIFAAGKRYIAFLHNDDYFDKAMQRQWEWIDDESGHDDTNPHYYKNHLEPDEVNDVICINGDLINPHTIEFDNGILYMSGAVGHFIGNDIEGLTWEYFELEISDDNGLVILKVEREDR